MTATMDKVYQYTANQLQPPPSNLQVGFNLDTGEVLHFTYLVLLTAAQLAARSHHNHGGSATIPERRLVILRRPNVTPFGPDQLLREEFIPKRIGRADRQRVLDAYARTFPQLFATESAAALARALNDALPDDPATASAPGPASEKKPYEPDRISPAAIAKVMRELFPGTGLQLCAVTAPPAAPVSLPVSSPMPSSVTRLFDIEVQAQTGSQLTAGSKVGIGVDLNSGAVVHFQSIQVLTADQVLTRQRNGAVLGLLVPVERFIVLHKLGQDQATPFATLAGEKVFQDLSFDDRLYVLNVGYKQACPDAYTAAQAHVHLLTSRNLIDASAAHHAGKPEKPGWQPDRFSAADLKKAGL